MSYPRIFNTYPEACTGCRICEMVCSLHHEKTGINPKRSMIRILDVSEKGIYIPTICRLCKNAPCVEACPSIALSQDTRTGVIHVDEEKCNGCGLCMEACKFGAISLHPEKDIAVVCDLCDGEPKCVKYCMQKALVFLKPEEYALRKAEYHWEKAEADQV